MEFKRVPALEKCFKILDLAADSGNGIGISESAKTLGYNKSTVFNIIHTLEALGVLTNGNNSRFVLGPRLYALGRLASKNLSLVDSAHPWLEKITAQTRLSSFLGIRAADKVAIIDKVDSPVDIKVSSEVGMRIPLLAGAVGKVFLAQMPDEEVVKVLRTNRLKAYTPKSCADPARYLEMVREVRRQGFGLDDEEYIEGIRAIAVPLITPESEAMAAVWVVGLSSQIGETEIMQYAALLKRAVKSIEKRLGFWDQNLRERKG